MFIGTFIELRDINGQLMKVSIEFFCTDNERLYKIMEANVYYVLFDSTHRSITFGWTYSENFKRPV